MIQDCYLAVKRWTPCFNPCDPSFGRTLVWIRFICLNVLYYDVGVLRTIASAIGKPVKFDVMTHHVEKGNFAKVCVEMDLSLLVIREVWMEDHWHLVEFESLHLICGRCDHYGHLQWECPKKLVPTEEPSLEKDEGVQAEGVSITFEAWVWHFCQSTHIRYAWVHPGTYHSIFLFLF